MWINNNQSQVTPILNHHSNTAVILQHQWQKSQMRQKKVTLINHASKYFFFAFCCIFHYLLLCMSHCTFVKHTPEYESANLKNKCWKENPFVQLSYFSCWRQFHSGASGSDTPVYDHLMHNPKSMVMRSHLRGFPPSRSGSVKIVVPTVAHEDTGPLDKELSAFSVSKRQFDVILSQLRAT